MGRKVIVEYREDKYLVVCREEKTFEFRRGEESELIDFIMDYLSEEKENAG